jgi:hypothetical protein
MFPAASLRTWMRAIHVVMTKFAFSFSAGERKIREHFVMKQICENLIRDEVSDMSVDQIRSLVDNPMRALGDPLQR